MLKATSRNDVNKKTAKKETSDNMGTFKMAFVMGRWVLRGDNGTIIEGRKKSLIKLCSRLNAMNAKKPLVKQHYDRHQNVAMED